MQDIPRNELLDKLASGWRVRVKTRSNCNTLCSIVELQGIDMRALIDADWEGEPPEPVCTGSLCAIVQAFEKLRDGAVFIRRPHWEKRRQITARHEFFNFETSDILANDWEVWG